MHDGVCSVHARIIDVFTCPNIYIEPIRLPNVKIPKRNKQIHTREFDICICIDGTKLKNAWEIPTHAH